MYWNSALLVFEKSTLDENGKVKKIESFDKGGNLNWTVYIKYYYDHSFLAKEEWFNDKNDLISQIEYDRYGNKTKDIEVSTNVQSKKKDTSYARFEYSNNKLINEVRYKSGFSEITEFTQYFYNPLGELIKRVTFDKNHLPSETYISQYDSFGNIISYKNTGGLFNDRFEHTISYEFDKKNNWIKRIEMKGTVPLYITERQITYNYQNFRKGINTANIMFATRLAGSCSNEHFSFPQCLL